MSVNTDIQMAELIARMAAKKGGRAYYVGGFVRDRLLGLENKDIDVEVHGISPRELEQILDSIGERVTIGQSFGVYALKGCELDIAMPRRERQRGAGHRDFDIIVDPFLGAEKAAKRRDFTVNAMMQDVLSGEVLDFFGGMDDLSARILRHVSDESFAEDALRVLRGAQFAARFAFEMAPETVELCRNMTLGALARERVEAELKKALLKAAKPSIFFRLLREMNRLDEWFQEVSALIGVEQNPRFHAEGDVWEHTMLVLDAAAKVRDKTENPYAFMLASLAHDFGKPAATRETDGILHAYGHESAGVNAAREFFARLGCANKTADYALPLIENHMRPNILAHAKAGIKATNKMFDSVPDPAALIYLALSDREGQRCEEAPEASDAFLFERLEIYREYMARPFVSGKDLVQAGLTPGENFSDILAYAHKLRLSGIEKQSALKQTLAYAKSRGNNETRP